MRKFTILICIFIFFTLFIAACTNSNSGSSTSSAATSAPNQSSTSSAVTDGKTLLETRCVGCHTLAKVVNRKGTADQWTAVVENMVQRGAVLSSDEKTVLVQYLADNFK